jgi:hypothetical protein
MGEKKETRAGQKKKSSICGDLGDGDSPAEPDIIRFSHF